MILNNKRDQIRLVWRLFMLVVPFFLAAYLLRYVPIRIQAGILMDRGLPGPAALSQARVMFLEDPVGVSVIGIIQGLLWFLLVCANLRYIEKRPCTSKSFGLSFDGKRLVLVAPGILLGLVIYFSYFAVEGASGQSSLPWSPVKMAVLPLILISLDMLANGFGEEAAFRAYWQRLLVDRHGLWFGIILASVSFVLLHLLVAHFTVIALLAGIFLACLLGILYVWSDSIFLVGALHTTLNLAPRLLGTWPSDISLLVVNGFTLAVAVILYLWVKRRG
jgi:membrane protease YdiL (CAAX protease family)